MSFSMKRVIVTLSAMCLFAILNILIKLQPETVAQIRQPPISPIIVINTTDNSVKYGKPAKISIKIAVTCCGNDSEIVEQTIVMMKSALIFTRTPIHFIIMADEAKFNLCKQILEWPKRILNQISFEILKPSFPNVKQPEFWRTAFRPCSSQRLFYPLLLPHHDSVLHIDGDVVFLTAVDQLWNYFQNMSDKQIAALATENLNKFTNWYLLHKDNVAPYQTKYALNAGIMPMNLTRMRQIKFFDELEPIAAKYHDKLPWFDQDVLNVYFHDHNDTLLFLPCRWNYLTDHCSRGNLCSSAGLEGVALLHGSRYTFHRNTVPTFRAVYRAIKNYRFDTNITTNLLEKMRNLLEETKYTQCGRVRDIFTKTIEQFANKLVIS